MGNAGSSSVPDEADDDSFYVLPPMVLLVDAVVWPETRLGNASSRSTSSASATFQSIMQRTKLESIKEVACTALLDGRKLGPSIKFPLAAGMTPPALQMDPRGVHPILLLHFATCTAEPRKLGEVKVPLHKLVKYGIPLYTTLWLGIPFGGRQEADTAYDLDEALARGSRPNTPKVSITVFRPAQNPEFLRTGSELEPDICKAIDEDGGFACVGSLKQSPTCTTQIKGLTQALRLMNSTAAAMQEELFFAGRSPGGASSPAATPRQQARAPVEEQLRQQNTALLDELTRTQDDLLQAQQKASTHAALTNKQEELDQLRQELKEAREKISQQEEQLYTSDLLLQELEDENANMRAELQDLRERDTGYRQNLKEELARACEELATLRAEQLERNDEVARARGDLADWNQALPNSLPEIAGGEEH